MGMITGMLGLGGGQNGTGVQGPQLANITSGTSDAQINQAYNQSQIGLQQQQQLLGAIQGQNGLGNQSSVYNQLQGVANGTGPNPAQAMLNQSTGQNVNNQAALMAGQRGASSNVGLMARQAAQQGANTQQQAVGQGATMQANQSLNALNSMGNIANTQAQNQIGATNSLSSAAQGEQNQILGANQAYNSAQVQNQASVNSANAGLAQTQMQGQQSTTGGILGGVGSFLGLAQGGPVRKMYAGGEYVQQGPSVPVTSSPPDLSRQPMQFQPGDTSGQLYGVQAPPAAPGQMPAAPSNAPKSGFNKFMAGAGKAMLAGQQNNPLQQGMASLVQGIGSSIKGKDPLSTDQGQVDAMNKDAALQAAPAGDVDLKQYMAKGGKVPALVSPGEVYIPPKGVKEVAKGKKDPISAGKKVPGKAKVPGNSYANDTVPATLEEGGIVLPKSVMESKNPHQEAYKFVNAILAKQGMKKK